MTDDNLTPLSSIEGDRPDRPLPADREETSDERMERKCEHPYVRLEHSASGNESQLVCSICGQAITEMSHT